MLKVFTSPSCSSCRKVKQWLNEQHISFQEKNIFSAMLNEKELKEILQKSENGTEDIISTRSKICREQNIDFDEMKVSELIEFIKNNPSVLKRPIIVDDRRIQVGYDEEEIRSFIPEARRIAAFNCSRETCPSYEECEHRKVKDEEE